MLFHESKHAVPAPEQGWVPPEEQEKEEAPKEVVHEDNEWGITCVGASVDDEPVPSVRA